MAQLYCIDYVLTVSSCGFQQQSFGAQSSGGQVSLVSWPDTEVDMDDKLVAIIVTIVQGESYDSLFRTVPLI